MIVSFRHKGLEWLFETGSTKGIRSEHKERLENILLMLHRAKTLKDLQSSPGLGLHPLKGEWEDFWAVKVNKTGVLFFVSMKNKMMYRT
jgi:proteic killer suppression protein